MAWRPRVDPPQLASCGFDREVCIWGQRQGTSPEAHDAWRLLARVDASERHSRTLRSLAWNPNGDFFALASFDATTSLWQEVDAARQGLDPEECGERCSKWECMGLVTGHENEVKSAAFSPSGEYLATCSRDKSVWIYSTEIPFEYECVAILQSHVQDVKMVKWHPTQDILFSCSYDDTVKVWGPDGDDWSCKETLSGHESTVWSISFDAQGTRFATCSDDRTLRIWAPGVGPPSTEVALGGDDGRATGARSVKGIGIAAAAFVSPLFHRPRLAQMAEAAKSAEVQSRVASPPAAGEAVVSRQAPKDAACAWHSLACIENAHPRPVYSVAWLPFVVPSAAGVQQVSSVATACGDNCVRVFQPHDETSLSSWNCVAEVVAHTGDVNAVAWYHQLTPGGGAILASAGDDSDVALWGFGSRSN